MTTETDYQQRYTQAQTAYLEGDLTEALEITDQLIQDYPEDPTILLLKGHICLQQENFYVAKKNYQQVLELSDRHDLINLANQGLEQITQEEEDNIYPSELNDPDFAEDIEELDEDDDGENWTSSIPFDSLDWDQEELEEEEIEDPTLQQSPPTAGEPSLHYQSKSSQTSPFDLDDDEFDDDEDITATSFESLQAGAINKDEEDNDFDIDPEELDFDPQSENINSYNTSPEDSSFDNEDDDTGVPTFVMSSEEDSELSDLEQMLTNSGDSFLGDFDDDYGDYSSALEPLVNTSASTPLPATSVHEPDDDDQPLVAEGEEDFFFAPDELDDIPDIRDDELPVSSIFTKEQRSQKFNDDSGFDNDISGTFGFDTDNLGLGIDSGDEDEIGTAPLSAMDSFVSKTPNLVTPEVEIPQGKLAKYYNLSTFNKQLVHGFATGIFSFLIVFIVTIFQGNIRPADSPESDAGVPYPWSNRIILALLTGIGAGGATVGAGYMMTKHFERYTNDLQNQFDSIYQGNYDVKTTVYSQDELGTLATSFNSMAKMIKITTTEARERAEKTEEERENLQKQVIKLLDDVEGASRGDLTVEAEVTADILGAVADAFNLTIRNLRKIVKQVKQAAVQVNKASTDSEVFARNQSSDALRMAEELAVTLNSVQMMTDSIQRVAENAREAEEVARSSSVTALKGGDAVERTVAGILQIRETVSETTRKVKRLAEASQQISTIVAVISNISSRTNLLALNASVQAARAGEAGRGFSIVAAEVRQLADRSAKSLQEIEQIVLQIQTETGSVMTAMEEGIQQVMDVTKRSEDAKRSLEDIIKVSNRIDALVRSITADTDEQRENSRGVAKVMQDVELTAQETSQESQRVAGSLQNLVGIAKDLIASVEKFRVDE